jgi:hypothetical protein
MAIGLSGDFFLLPVPRFIPLRFLLSRRTIRVFGSRTLRSSRDPPGDTSKAQDPRNIRLQHKPQKSLGLWRLKQ